MRPRAAHRGGFVVLRPEQLAEIERHYGGPIRPEFPHWIADPQPGNTDPHAPRPYLQHK